MHIYYINDQIPLIVRQLPDQLCEKSINYTTQLLCNSHRILDGYQKTVDVNGISRIRWVLHDITLQNLLLRDHATDHPLTTWINSGHHNYMWVYEFYLHLLSEHFFHHGSKHKYEVFLNVLKKSPSLISHWNPFTAPPITIPKKIGVDITTLYKQRIAVETQTKRYTWTNRDVPDWVKNNV